MPFVLVANQTGRLVVSAANPAAGRAGIHPGMGLADARAVAPELASRPAEPERDRRALTQLARWCARYGPAFNTDGTDGLWVDSTGVAHLFGGEPQLIADLRRRLVRFGLTARPGLADGLGAASALARYTATGHAPHTTRIAPPGGARAALAPLPVEALRLEAETVRLLTRLGLKRIGQLIDLPRPALQRRFASRQAAAAVLLRLDQALGIKSEPLRPLSPPPEHVARAAYSEPLIASAGLEAALARLIEELAASLARTGRGARRLALTLHRSDGTRAVIRAGLSRPSRSAPHLFGLLNAKLETIDAGYGIDLMVLNAYDSGPLLPAQKPLARLLPDLAQNSQTAGRAETIAPLIDRLSGRLGAGAVMRLEPRASHLPERAEALVAALSSQPSHLAACLLPHLSPGAPGPAVRASSNAIRPPLLLACPEPIEVVAEVPEGPPRRLRWRRSLTRILRAEGPERIAAEWWHEIGARTSAARDYYVIEDDTGARFWVFREGSHGGTPGELSADERNEAPSRPPAWYLHGIFA